MEYNPMLHRYHLTPQGLLHYGIDAERKYISDNPNKMDELIQKTSKKVYDYINYRAGFSRYQIMMYRIATAPRTIYPNQYFMFEVALTYQARYIVESGDSARYSRVNIEKDAQARSIADEVARDDSDMSPECVRTLEALGLLRWFAVPNSMMNPDTSKY